MIGLCFSILVRIIKGQELRAPILKFFLPFRWEIIERSIHGKAIGLQKCIELLIQPAFLIIGKRLNSSQTEWRIMIRKNPPEISLQGRPQAHTGGAGAEGIIERKYTGFRFRQGNAAVRAGKVGTEEVVFSAHYCSYHETIPQFQGSLYRVSKPAHNAILDNDAVHHHLDGMLFILFQFNVVRQRENSTIYPYPDITFLSKLFQQFFMGSLLLGCHRSQDHQFRPFSQCRQGIHNLIHCLPLDGFSALRAESPAGMSVEHAKVIVDFCDRTYGGTGIVARRFLVDRNSR